MGKIKKLKGWNYYLFISPDEELLTLCNTRNGVYVYDINTKNIVFQTRTVSNVAHVVVSPDKKFLAAKNTSGTLAIISMETGEEICRDPMEKCEGWQMTFTEDSSAVLDLDWNGHTMLLTTEGQHILLDGPAPDKKKKSPPFVFMKYDPYTKQIYKFVKDHPDYYGNYVLTSPADKDHISYNELKRITGRFPDHLSGISFCRKNIYYFEDKNIIVCDRQFRQVNEIRLPLEDTVAEEVYMGNLYVSPAEKYALFRPTCMWPVSYLFELETKKLVRRFDYPYAAGFTMIHDDKEFLFSTWEGTFVGEV